MAQHENPFLSVIIPAYNEERRIGRTLQAVDAYLAKKPWSWEILVVSDGSTDGTVRVVEGYKNLIKNLRLIDNAENRGKGYVVRQGMHEARGALRLITDADNATPIEELEKLLPWINMPEESKGFISGWKGGYDVVIGSIGVKESQVEQGERASRKLVGLMANVLIQIVLLPGIRDTQRGFKLFTAQSAQKTFSPARITRWGWDMEVLALARKFKFRIKEVGIRWIHDPESKVTASAYFKTLFELFKIRWWLWIGSYKNTKS